jgi:hypothetical protein
MAIAWLLLRRNEASHPAAPRPAIIAAAFAFTWRRSSFFNGLAKLDA